MPLRPVGCDTVQGANVSGEWRLAALLGGSGLFVVYTDERETTSLTQPPIVRGLENRAFVVKINPLLRF